MLLPKKEPYRDEIKAMIDRYKLSSPDDWQEETAAIDQTDYFGHSLRVGEFVYIGDAIVRKDDLYRFNECVTASLTIQDKITILLDIFSLTIDEDVAQLTEIDGYLSEVLANKIESIGIVAYYKMTEEIIQ